MNTRLNPLLIIVLVTASLVVIPLRGGEVQASPAPASSTVLNPGWMRVADQPDLANRGMRTVYDSHRDVVVMFGGWLDQTGDHTNLTWEFDGAVWQQIVTPASPPARIWHGMAYDSTRHVVVVYGGEDESGVLNDTWEYDGSTWVEVVTPHFAAASYGFGMAYDSCRERVVLYGGNGDNSITWEYDGLDWQQVLTPNFPGHNFLTAMVFAAGRCRVVLFGGGNNQTWEYDGVDWEQVITPHQPLSRWAHAMAYNPLSDKVVMFGGYGPEYPNGEALGDTWEYDGSDWLETSPAGSPAPREQHAMAFEGASGKVLLFGGFGRGDTWLYGLTARLYLPVGLRTTSICVDRPLLLWPAAGATINTLIPAYLWDSCDLPEAIYTHLQIAPNPDMSDWVLSLYDSPTNVGSFQEYEKNLVPDTTYYWRIRAVYGDDDFGPYSSGSFRTAPNGPVLPPPELLYPFDDMTLPGTTVTFNWQPVSGAVKYLIVIGWTFGQIDARYYAYVEDTQTAFNHLPPNQPCYWVVSSVTDYAIGEPSAPRYFTSGP